MVLRQNTRCELKIRVEKKMNLLALGAFPSPQCHQLLFCEHQVPVPVPRPMAGCGTKLKLAIILKNAANLNLNVTVPFHK